jgi:hypothetical protein
MPHMWRGTMSLRSTTFADSRWPALSLEDNARQQNWSFAMRSVYQGRPVSFCFQAFLFSTDGRRPRRISGVAVTLAYPLTRRRPGRRGTSCVETGSCASLCLVSSLDSFAIRFVTADDVHLAISEPLCLGQHTDEIFCPDGS